MQRIRKVKSMLAVALALLMLWTSGVDVAFVVLAESIPDAEVTTPAPKPAEKPQPVEKSAEIKAPEDSSKTPEPSKEPDEKKESASDGETPEPSASVGAPEPEVKAENPENMEAAGTPSPEHEVESEETDAKTAPATQFTSGYAGVMKQTTVYSGRGTSFDAVGTVTASNSVVYVTDRFGTGDSENDWLQIAFYVKGEDAASTGYIRARRATPLTEEQSDAYIKKYADSDDAVLFLNRKDIPLKAIEFELAEAGEASDATATSEATAAPEETISSEQTEVQNEEDETSKPATEVDHSEIIGYAVVSTDGGELNVRATASTDAKVLTRLANGERVAVLGVEGDWTRVDVNGVQGYVASHYLTMEEETESSELSAGIALMADIELLAEDELTTTTVSARVDWVYGAEDAGAAEYLRGDVTVRLLRNGVAQTTLTLKKSNNWQGQWIDLPLTDESGEPYVYTVQKTSGGFFQSILPYLPRRRTARGWIPRRSEAR